MRLRLWRRKIEDFFFSLMPRPYKIKWHKSHYPLYKALMEMNPNTFIISTWDNPLNE